MKELLRIMSLLERYYLDMQDIEFVVEDGRVFVLQTRSAQRTAKASVHVAVSMVEEGLLTERGALLRIDASKMDYFSRDELDMEAPGDHVAIAKGIAASHGAVSGRLAFTHADCVKLIDEGSKVIFCARDISTTDLSCIQHADAVVTIEGGLTSEVAVLCRAMNKVCVTGAKAMQLGALSGPAEAAVRQALLVMPEGAALTAGGEVTVDGSRYASSDILNNVTIPLNLYVTSGVLYVGKIPTLQASLDKSNIILIIYFDY